MTTMNLVVPCYNEEEVITETSKRLLALLERLIEAGEVSNESRITFIDDGSRDRTWSIIEVLHAQNARCGGIKLSRNRGHQNALLAGLMTAQGDVLVSLDADLQDDIEAIPRMLAEYQSGAEIVFGVRHKRTTDTFFKRFTARNYYKLLRTFGVDILPGHADFRLMSRKTVEALRQFQEVNLFLRGIIPLLGFKTAIVEYERAARFAGESKYPLSKMIVLALDGITSFSAVPLQWSTRIGALLAVGSLCFGAWAAYARIFTNLTVPGWASTVIPMYFLGGIQLLFLGVIGGYISKTYAETKQRPRFIIEQTL
ncbi:MULTISPECIES: glycosyltransferase family 2 protein [unclassified Paraburkholderia]|uniref:glycosyltransferase family 2 protein n=1 Tax=unclassified Paraburkholderia TaxID=2615204 RepID=UPI00161672C2|nr:MULTISPECIES: glycosyltransferase family 2 protein [unclassified Paraburkholderia]MBB5444772.1 glycosyltransferase involved in cell wall biosynthesis [Paraburkholderia sp. WSM4177]MBB5484870.1 glycosyltransferase involved in cell wall biosynthesis [Paraburkholderia sp. WSM4180]